MAQVRIHNITDRPNVDTPAYAVTISGEKIRPGKFITVDSSVLTPKFLKLHGTAVWVGDDVPQKFKATSRAALKAEVSAEAAMTIEEARSYLASLQKEELVDLCDAMAPALSFTRTPSIQMLVVKLARACFSDTRVLDPEAFFWLRRWVQSGNTFIEIG